MQGGSTPLYEAAKRGYTRVVTLLLKAGGDAMAVERQALKEGTMGPLEVLLMCRTLNTETIAALEADLKERERRRKQEEAAEAERMRREKEEARKKKEPAVKALSSTGSKSTPPKSGGTTKGTGSGPTVKFSPSLGK